METNATVVYETEAAKAFIDSITSKNRAPEINHLDYNIKTYTDQTQKQTALEEADKFMRSVTPKSNNNDYGTIRTLDSRAAKDKATISYNNDYVKTKNNNGLMNLDNIEPDKDKLKSKAESQAAVANTDFYDEDKALSKRVVSSNQKTTSKKELDDILSLMKQSLAIVDKDGNVNMPLMTNLEYAKALVKTLELKTKDQNAKLTDEQNKIMEAYLSLKTNEKYGDGFEKLAEDIDIYIHNTSKNQEVKALNESYLKTLNNGSLAGYIPYNGTDQKTLVEAGTIKKASGDESKSMAPKDGPGKKFLQEVDSLYKTNLKYVIYKNAYIQSDVEKSLTAYWSHSSGKTDILLGGVTGEIKKEPPIIGGIKDIKSSYVDALNASNGANYYFVTDAFNAIKTNYMSFGSMFTHTPNPMPIPSVEVQVDKNGAIGFKNHFPNAFMGSSTKSTHGTGGNTFGIQTTADMLGYNSVVEFLLGGAPFTDDTHMQANILKNQYASPANTDKENDDTRRKYFNSAIKLLAQSMPDLTPNMFDVILTVGNTKPISIFSDAKALRTQLLYNESSVVPIQGRKDASIIDFKTGQENIDFDSRDFKDRIVNARSLAMRCTGIKLPGIESSTYDIEWLNHTITKPGSRSTRTYTSSMNIRLDMPLFFADAILELAGQYSVAKFNDPIRYNYYLNHFYFYKDGNKGIGGKKSLDNVSNDTRINLYVPLFDFNNVKNNPNANAGGLKEVSMIANIANAKKMPFNAYGWPNDYNNGTGWAHNTRLMSTPVYCFEDVRFLGADNLSFTTGGGDSPMTMPVEFTFRRFYKFLWDMNAQW